MLAFSAAQVVQYCYIDVMYCNGEKSVRCDPKIITGDLYNLPFLQLRPRTVLDQEVLNECLTIQPLQPAISPQDPTDNSLGKSPGPIHDVYPGIKQKILLYDYSHGMLFLPHMYIIRKIHLMASMSMVLSQLTLVTFFQAEHQAPKNTN